MALAHAGRLLVALYFIATAATLMSTFEKTTGGPAMRVVGPKLSKALAGIMRRTGYELPIQKGHYPQLLLATATTYMLGSLLLLSNTRAGAYMLLLGLGLSTVVLHNFWDQANSTTYYADAEQFLKNVAIAGGLMVYLGS